MFDFFSAGGFVMFPVALLGLVAVGAGACHGLAPSDAWRRSAASLRSAVVLLSACGAAIDLRAVAAYVASSEVAEGSVATVLVVGGGEAISPLVLGTLLAAVSALFAAAGDARR